MGINGEIAGLDYLSCPAAFKFLYNKLLKSYIMDALLQNKKTKKRITKERARLFLQSIVEAEETKHPSVSCGHDYRYEGTQVIASALVGGKELIHLTAFSIDQSSSLSKKTKRRLTRYRNKMELRRFNNE